MSSEQQQPDEQPLSRLLHPKEAFRLIGVGHSKGYSLIQQDAIPGIVRLGKRCTRIRSAVLMRWLRGEHGKSR